MGVDHPWRSAGPGSSQRHDWSGLAAAAGPRTTLRVRDGNVLHREAHLQRLREAAALLGLVLPWLADAFDTLLSPPLEGIFRLRLVAPSEVLLGRWEEAGSLPIPYLLDPRIHPLGEVRGEPRAPHKGLMGNWSGAALEAAHLGGAHDLLCLWPDGTIAETAIASLAVVAAGILRVPPAEGRVRSLAEALELPGWAAERGLRIERGPIHLAEILPGSLLCFNAARGLWQAEILPPKAP